MSEKTEKPEEKEIPKSLTQDEIFFQKLRLTKEGLQLVAELRKIVSLPFFQKEKENNFDFFYKRSKRKLILR